MNQCLMDAHRISRKQLLLTRHFLEFKCRTLQRCYKAIEYCLKYKELQVGNWTAQDQNYIKKREIKYVMPIRVSLLPAQEAQIIDEEMILENDPDSFILEKHCISPKMPYSDDFIPTFRFCVNRQQQGAHLTASVWIRWLQKPLLVKSRLIISL